MATLACRLPRTSQRLWLLRSSLTCIPYHYSFAQSYYTLSSIYTASQGPPQVHLHLRRYDLPSLPTKTTPDAPAASHSSEVPVGTATFSPSLAPTELDDALTAAEREAFDLWLRERWTEKDELLSEFYRSGKFKVGDESQRREIKLELRGIDDWVSGLSMARGVRR